MSGLYRCFKPKEGDQVQFFGVYALKWPRDLLGEPKVAFVEVDDPLYEAAPDMLKICKEMLEFMEHAPFDFSNGVEYMGIDEGNTIGWPFHKELTGKLCAIIAKATGAGESHENDDQLRDD